MNKHEYITITQKLFITMLFEEVKNLQKRREQAKGKGDVYDEKMIFGHMNALLYVIDKLKNVYIITSSQQ